MAAYRSRRFREVRTDFSVIFWGGWTMSNSWNGNAGPSRRTLLKTAAGVAAGTLLTRSPLWAQAPGLATAAGALAKINPQLMMTPAQALDWNMLKAQAGPTYAGSTGWKLYTDFLIAKMPEFGAVDLDYVDIPYDHYIVEDWPDRATHMADSGKAIEKLVSDGKPVPVVA